MQCRFFVVIENVKQIECTEERDDEDQDEEGEVVIPWPRVTELPSFARVLPRDVVQPPRAFTSYMLPWTMVDVRVRDVHGAKNLELSSAMHVIDV